MSDKKGAASKSSKAEDKSKATGAGKDAKDETKEAKGTAVVDLGFLEADDDFEEFPAEEWKAKKTATGEPVEEEDEPLNIWEDNWDDDNIEEDFSKQLK